MHIYVNNEPLYSTEQHTALYIDIVDGWLKKELKSTTSAVPNTLICLSADHC